MIKRGLLLTAFSLVSLYVAAQAPKFMVYIPGGATEHGGGYDYKIVEHKMVLLGDQSWLKEQQEQGISIGEIPPENVPKEQVSVEGFYLATHEVTNKEYHEFLVRKLLSKEEADDYYDMLSDRKRLENGELEPARERLFALAEQNGLMPDQDVWHNDFVLAYNEPLVLLYFEHVAFANYPVVGVSWEQAKAFCEWKTEDVNGLRAEKGKAPLPPFRLPTEAEWEHAARAAVSYGEEAISTIHYPWRGNSLLGEKGQYQANIRVRPTSYIDDNFEYTAPVGSYEPNGLGLYDMAGNVAEWCEDVYRFSGEKMGLLPESDEEKGTLRVIKGGSWADFGYAALCGSRTMGAQASSQSRVGFRIAMDAF